MSEDMVTSLRYELKSDDYKITDLVGNEIDGELISYNSELKKFIISDLGVSTFIILDGSDVHYSCFDKRSKEWVLFNEFEYDLKEGIKRKLGHPVVRVELTEAQLKDCIDDSIKEISPWVVQPESVTVDAAESIDMSEYPIAYIINVVSADQDTSLNSGIVNGRIVDIFAANYYLTRGYQESFYSSIESSLIDRTKAEVQGGIHWKWMKKTHTLMLDVGCTSSRRVTVEYSPLIKSVDDLVDEIYLEFVRKFSLAFARETLSGIRGKFTVDGSPVSLDADNQESKSSAELDRLRQDLKDTVSTHFMTD